MRTEVLQPWTTIQGSGSVTTITQEEECWADFSDSGAATFWLDVRSISGTVILQLASSPTKDESLFLPITIPVTLNPLTTPTPLTTVAGVTAQSGVTATFLAPLARWVRWSVSSSSGGVWNATFRIRASRSRTPYFSPTMAPGCQLWLRSDMGVVASGASVTGWDDLSGNGYAFPAVNTPYALHGPRSRRVARHDRNCRAWTNGQRVGTCSFAARRGGTVMSPISTSSWAEGMRARVAAQYLGASSR
jgi:hypothetical protein